MNRFLKIIFISVLACSLLAAGIFAVPSFHRLGRLATAAAVARVNAPATVPFPAIQPSALTPLQAKVISLAAAEYANHPASFDANVMKYTQGNNDAWCADFLSWVMLHAGVPYTNPYSGSWRIPGVFTLQEYYRSQHRYMPVGQYRPKPGDVAFVHFGGQDLYGQPDGHVEMIIKVSGNMMTTVGGNEGGKMRIDTQPIIAGNNGLVGFGILATI